MMRAGARRRKSLPGGARRHAMCSRSSMTVRFDPYPVREFDLSGVDNGGLMAIVLYAAIVVAGIAVLLRRYRWVER